MQPMLVLARLGAAELTALIGGAVFLDLMAFLLFWGESRHAGSDTSAAHGPVVGPCAGAVPSCGPAAFEASSF